MLQNIVKWEINAIAMLLLPMMNACEIQILTGCSELTGGLSILETRDEICLQRSHKTFIWICRH